MRRTLRRTLRYVELPLELQFAVLNRTVTTVNGQSYVLYVVLLCFIP